MRMSGFKNFVLRSNLVELAVAVVIGTQLAVRLLVRQPAALAALVVYYVMVMPVSHLLHLLERSQAATTRDCPECTMSIPIAAQRCPGCTAVIAPGTHQPQPVSTVGS